MEAGSLVQMCLEAACKNNESVRAWRKQRRTLERMPSPLAETLLNLLLRNHLLSPPLLEMFQRSVEELELSGEIAVGAEWMAYVGGFRHLRVLRVADCKALTNAAIWYISGLESLEEVRMDRCRKITDDGLAHILSLKNLKNLGLSETGIGRQGLGKLFALRKIAHLDLGGLPVTDSELYTLQVLGELTNLSLWGSKISNSGVLGLRSFPKLEVLNLAWTDASVIPPLLSLKWLNLCNCKLVSVFEELDSSLTLLDEILLSGASFEDASRCLSSGGLTRVKVLDLSNAQLSTFGFLSGMTRIARLDLSSTKATSDAMYVVASVGQNLKWLNLSNTQVGSDGIGALAGNVPYLKEILLSATAVDSMVFGYLGLIPSLCSIDLSKNNMKGISNCSVSVHDLQQLRCLQKLDLRESSYSDKRCKRLACLVQLKHILLRNDFLTDASLLALSGLSNLVSLTFQGCVLTDTGLLSFRPPQCLKQLDLSDCWLLTENSLHHFMKTNPTIALIHESLITSQKMPRATKSKSREEAAAGTLPENKQVRDERIKYTMDELCSLRISASSPLPNLLQNHPLVI